jgi:MFS family permease
MSKERIFTRTVWLLGFVSLFTDISSEMLYPVMPVYLDHLGYTALWIGMLEGVAEAIVGLSKGYFGKLSDDTGKRLPFVRLGYFLSSLSKPMIVLFSNIGWILFARSTDRLGKGIRTGARDALLSDESSRENKGKVFGLHRAMDTLGAAIGPVLALLWLRYYPGEYKPLFLYAFIPAIIGVALLFILREKKRDPASLPSRSNFFSYFGYWKRAGSEYRRLVAGLLVFTLFNSSDVFLLLMAKKAGVEDTHVIGAYIFYNLVYALFAYPAGSVADKLGMKTSFITGLMFFCATYAGMAFLELTDVVLFSLFFLYGIYAAATEGISKAWIARLSASSETGTAIGFYASASSIAAMIASTAAGWLWVAFFPGLTFMLTAIASLLVAIYLIFAIKENRS